MKKTKADEIRSIRESLGLTRTAFAARLCVAPSTVQRWEEGKVKPYLSVDAIAERTASAAQNQQLAIPDVLNWAVKNGVTLEQLAELFCRGTSAPKETEAAVGE